MYKKLLSPSNLTDNLRRLRNLSDYDEESIRSSVDEVLYELNIKKTSNKDIVDEFIESNRSKIKVTSD